MLEVGQPCPAFTTTLDNGDSLSTDQLIGRPFAIFFYPKADTPGCTKESIAFSALKPQFDALGVRVLGASKDKVAKQGKFRDKHSLTVELIADDEGDLCEQFGVWQEKSMYGKTYMGVVRSTFLFDAKGTLIESWPKVKVDGHPEAVLERAQSL